MTKYNTALRHTKLFSGLEEEEISAMLHCLKATFHTYQKGEYVFRQGDSIENITILAAGRLLIQSDDFWGNRSIVHVIHAGEMFGEAYASPESGPILNDVIAEEDSTVIFMDVHKILTTCSSSCKFHSIVIQNLFSAISEKNRKLVRKMGHLSKRSIRAKLISYLSEEAKHRNSNCFVIPFTRQQLADFLSVDRSAMSRELCRMRDEGLLSFHRNRFTLL